MATSNRPGAGVGYASLGSGAKSLEDWAARRKRRFSEFPIAVRARVEQLAMAATALEDLADSFPGLLFALASDYNDDLTRERAISLILQGCNLRHIADTVALPFWLRRLPPAAFTELLPRLPVDADFGLRLGSYIPHDKRRAAGWLTAVSDAYLVGGREFALWTARAWSTMVISALANRSGLLVAWFWFSSNPGTHGHSLLRGAFDNRMSASTAADEFNVWLKRVALVEWLGTGTLEPWIPDAKVGGYEFRMLRCAEDFIAAAAALDNCLEQFATRLSNGVSSVARISRGGRIIACIEVGLHSTDTSMPAIEQLRGHKNEKVTPEVWRRCYDWLANAPLEPFRPDRLTPPAASRMEARQVLWGPFLAALDNHSDPAGRVAANRLRRTLVPRLRNAPTSTRTVEAAPVLRRMAVQQQMTMLQRVREHLATLTGSSHAENELMRWDSVERLEAALRGRTQNR